MQELEPGHFCGKIAEQFFGPMKCQVTESLESSGSIEAFEVEKEGISPAERCRAWVEATVFHSISYLWSLW